MTLTLKSRRIPQSRQRAERGYILLTLLLFIALLTIAATAIAPSIVFEVKRDREEELIHRGVQYSRAVRHYFKKFGRYPSSIEDLENTNNYRSLRKRYKDPITGKDFKLLHLGEVQLALGPGIGGLGASLAQAANGASGLGGQLGKATSAFGGGNLGAIQQLVSTAQAASASPVAPADSSSADNSGAATSSDQSDSGKTGANTVRSGTNNVESGSSTDKVQTFGGGPFVGVVSTSKNQSIRQFNKKDHYNQWLFIYDPQSDRGGLLNTPAQPPLQGAVSLAQPGASGTAGTLNSTGQGFGNQGAGTPAAPFGGGTQQTPQTPPPQQQEPPQQ